jgi:hypothetical protein
MPAAITLADLNRLNREFWDAQPASQSLTHTESGRARNAGSSIVSVSSSHSASFASLLEH